MKRHTVTLGSVPVRVEQLAVELGATPSEIVACAWELRRSYLRVTPEFVTDELAARIRTQLPVRRERKQRQRQAARDRLERQLTAQEIAAELQIAASTIRQWKARGYLQATGYVRRAHLYRFGDVVDARRLINQRTKSTPATDPWPRLELQDRTDRGVTTRQAAGLVNVKPSTIRMWVRRGHLAPIDRHDRQLVFVVRDVYAAAARNST